MFSQPSYLGSRCLFWKEGFTGPLCPSCLYRGSPWRGRWGHPATRLSHQTTQQHTQPSSLLSAQHENTSLNKKKGRKKLETAEQQMGRMGLGSFLIPLPKPDPATPHTWTQPLGQCHPPFLSARNHSWMLTSPKGSTGAVMGPAGSCAAPAGLFPFGSRMHIGKMLGEALGVPKSQGVVLSHGSHLPWVQGREHHAWGAQPPQWAQQQHMGSRRDAGVKPRSVSAACGKASGAGRGTCQRQQLSG